MKGYQPNIQEPGYDAVPQYVLAPSEDIAHDVQKCCVHDASLQISDELMEVLGRAVERGTVSPTVAGCSGLSPFIKYVPYLSYNNFFLLPPAHAFCLGVMRDFWTYAASAKVIIYFCIWEGT